MKRLPLLIAVGYPLILFGVLFIVARKDPFGIFDELYLLATGVVAPALATTVLVILWRRDDGPTLLKTLGLVGWVILVTLAHFWLVAEFAKGV